jgi:hypothetical protein
MSLMREMIVDCTGMATAILDARQRLVTSSWSTWT